MIIVGGSIAGLSAALCLGRSLRQVLVVDAGQPCNRAASEAHNLIGFDGSLPKEIHSIGYANAAAYQTVDFVSGTVTNILVEKEGGQYPISTILLNNDTARARKLILATGVQDLLPPIPGLGECWGKTAIHCPYCDGYEFRDKKTAFIGISPSAVLVMAQIVSKISGKLYIIGSYEFTKSQLDQFKRHSIDLLPYKAVSLQHSNGILESIKLDNNHTVSMDVVYVRPPHRQSPVVSTLDLELNEQGYIKLDPATQKTNVSNIYAVGDCTDSNRALSIAMGSGTRCGKMINFELSVEDWKK